MMRLTTLLSVIALCLSVNGFGQNYLNSTSQWYDLFGDSFDQAYRFSNHQIDGDTVINSKTYYKVKWTYDFLRREMDTPYDTIEYTQNLVSEWYLREENKKFYRVSGTSEIMIIDFDLEIGDVLTSLGEEVTAIDTFMFNNEPRRRYTTNQNHFIYEGIAASRSLRAGLEWFGDESQGFTKCFRQNGEEIKFGDSDVVLGLEMKPCKMLPDLISGVKTIDKVATIEIYPNPTAALFSVASKERIESIVLMDNLGRRVAAFLDLGTRTFSGDLSNFPKGIYFLLVETKEGFSTEKVIRL